MALGFDDTANSELTGPSPLITGLPISGSLWFYATTDLGQITRMYCLQSAVNRGIEFTLDEGGTPDVVYLVLGNSGGLSFVGASTGFSYNTWQQGSFTVIENGNPGMTGTVYYNGGNSNTANRNGTTDAFTLQIVGGPLFGGSNMQGNLAEVGLWNVALTAAEHWALGRGYSPLLIRPESLIYYLPLFDKASPSKDIVSGTSWTWTNSPSVQTHPPNIIYPGFIKYGIPSAATAAEMIQQYLLLARRQVLAPRSRL